MRRLRPWLRFLPVLLLLAATSFFLEVRGGRENLPPHQDLARFPMQIGDRLARDLPLTRDELTVLGPAEFLMRDYLNRTGEPPVNLFIAYFPSQRSGDTIHSPKNCLPGSGWTPLESGQIAVQRSDGTGSSINRYVVGKGVYRYLVFYWYEAHGRVTASEYWAKIYLVVDAVRLNRTDGALVRIVTPIVNSEDEAAAQVRALGFIRQVRPDLDAYIPR